MFNEAVGNKITLLGYSAYKKFKVSNIETGDQTSPSIATLSDGKFVVVFTSENDNTSNSLDIYMQVFFPNGTRFSKESRVNNFVDEVQKSPSVASLGNGGFVVAWTSWEQTDTGFNNYGPYDIYAKIYDAYGGTAKSDFLVNNHTANTQTLPSVAASSQEGFAVIWSDHNYNSGVDRNGFAVRCALFDNTGKRTSEEFQVNHYTAGWQITHGIISLVRDYVISWSGPGQEEESGIHLQMYHEEKKVGSKFLLETSVGNSEKSSVQIEGLINGGFVITWLEMKIDEKFVNVNFQILNNETMQLGDVFSVNTSNDFIIQKVCASSVMHGGFVVVWCDKKHIFSQGYDEFGNPVGGESLIFELFNAFVGKIVSASPLKEGGFVIAWDSVRHNKSEGKTIYGATTQENFKIEGTEASEILVGGNGNDILIGYGGNDNLTGKGGDDVFVIHPKTKKSIINITDFGSGLDKIDLSSFGEVSVFFLLEPEGTLVFVDENTRIMLGGYNISDANETLLDLFVGNNVGIFSTTTIISSTSTSSSLTTGSEIFASLTSTPFTNIDTTLTDTTSTNSITSSLLTTNTDIDTTNLPTTEGQVETTKMEEEPDSSDSSGVIWGVVLSVIAVVGIAGFLLWRYKSNAEVYANNDQHDDTIYQNPLYKEKYNQGSNDQDYYEPYAPKQQQSQETPQIDMDGYVVDGTNTVNLDPEGYVVDDNTEQTYTGLTGDAQSYDTNA